MSATISGSATNADKPGCRRLLGVYAHCGRGVVPVLPARRNFLAGGVAALGLGAVAAAARPAKVLAAQSATEPPRIDVHHHYLPPVHAAALTKHSGRAPKWTLQATFDDMDKAGVGTAVLSLVPPGVWFGDVAEGRTLARACNEYGAKLKADNQGDPAFVPVFEELNRRKAVVYTHPVNPACCTHLADGVRPSSIEFATDTTRTIASLMFGKGGTAFRTADVKFIWSHSGGTLPFLIGRFIREQLERKDPRMPDGPEAIIRRYFYEIAQGHEPGQFAALLKIAPVSQLMFGSDFPYREAAEAAKGLEAYPFSATERASIDRGTAIKMMPQLAA